MGNGMMAKLERILRSTFALPVWVIAWITFFLIPANLSGYFLLQYETGFWVAVLGGTALLINTVILFLNGGMSKVLAIPHLIFWLPLQIILGYRLMNATDLSSFETNYLIVMLVINGISLCFDFYDTRDWWKGNRAVVGYENEKPFI